MRNGMYKVEFATPRGAGYGIVILNNGKVQGGDTSMYYNGTYQMTGDQFKGSVTVRRHSAALPSVFGLDDLTINLSGKGSDDQGQLTGTSPQVPGVSLQARLKRLAD